MNFLKLSKQDNEKNLFYYKIFRNVSFITGIFCLIISLFLILNFIHIQINDPVDSPQLKKMILQSQQDDENEEIKSAVRELDLIIRKAYFTNLTFTSQGTYFLLAGLSVFLICLKIMYDMKRVLPDSGKFIEVRDEPKTVIIIQKSIFILGGILILAAILLPRIFPSNIAGFLQERKKIRLETISLYASKEQLQKNWPNFRGYNSLGIAYTSQSPVQWDGTTGENILWKSEIPKSGFSSPIVWSNKVFITGADAQSREVFCYDSLTGELLWKKDTGIKISKIPEVDQDVGLAAPTMTIDGYRVFAIFATGELICLDLDGQIIWKKKLETPENHYGHSSSLITYNDLLLVQYDHGKGAKLIAFKTSTGEQEWKKNRNVDISWASPVIIEEKEGDQLILSAMPPIVSYDPGSGKLLWEMNDVIDGEIGPSPAYSDGILFIVNQFARLAAINVSEQKIIWEYDDDLPEASSPVANRDYLILPTSYGTTSLLNAKTGELYMVQRFKSGSYASPIIAGDKVYLMDKKGIMHIFKLNTKFTLISQPKLGEPSIATPAFIEDRIYLRGNDHLYCIRSIQKNEKD